MSLKYDPASEPLHISGHDWVMLVIVEHLCSKFWQQKNGGMDAVDAALAQVLHSKPQIRDLKPNPET